MVTKAYFVTPTCKIWAEEITHLHVKVVLEGYHRYFFGVKVKTVKLIGGRRFLAARSGLNVRRLLYMSAQIIQMMAFTQIMAIWTPAITL